MAKEKQTEKKKSRWVFRIISRTAVILAYPTMAKAIEEISRYCEERGETCVFTGDDEVEIEGKRYEIYRGYENGSRGNYGIKCREK